MFLKKRTYVSSVGCVADDKAPAERDSIWRLAEKARRAVFPDVGSSLNTRRERLGGHADFNRKA